MDTQLPYADDNLHECRVPRGSDVDPATLCSPEPDAIVFGEDGVLVHVYRCLHLNRDGTLSPLPKRISIEVSYCLSNNL